jgi:hypothetical protein
MKKLVEYERLKAEAAEATLKIESQRVQSYRTELKDQANEDRKRIKEKSAKERSISPGFLGKIPLPDLYESRRHQEHFQKHYQQYLSDINHQVLHKKQREIEDRKRTENEVRRLIEADKRSVELAKSKSREIIQRNKEIQQQIWTDNQVKKKADQIQRHHENSVEREHNLRASKEIERNIKDHSQKRRVKDLLD